MKINLFIDVFEKPHFVVGWMSPILPHDIIHVVSQTGFIKTVGDIILDQLENS